MRLNCPESRRHDAVARSGERAGSPGPGIALLRRAPVGVAALVALALALAGCATPGTGDPRDPLEPLNRGIFEFNEVVDRNVVRPIAEAYVAVLPVPARTGVSNFFGNFYDFWNAVNNLLQGKVATAFSDVGRIALNTTVGLLGFVDVASRVGLQKSDEDLGQTLAWWGIGHGPYLVLPLFGPSSLRDGTALAATIAFDPLTYVIDDRGWTWGLWGLRLINVRADLLGASRVFDEAATDRYAFMRDAFYQRRRNQLWDGNPPREKDFSAVKPSVVELAPIWQRLPDPADGFDTTLPSVSLPAGDAVQGMPIAPADAPAFEQPVATGGQPMGTILVSRTASD